MTFFMPFCISTMHFLAHARDHINQGKVTGMFYQYQFLEIGNIYCNYCIRNILENMTFYNIDRLYRWHTLTIIYISHIWLCPYISCVILRLIKYKRPNMFRYLKLPTAFIAYKAFWWVPNKFEITCLNMCASFFDMLTRLISVLAYHKYCFQIQELSRRVREDDRNKSNDKIYVLKRFYDYV